jgi:hypothetical protein
LSLSAMRGQERVLDHKLAAAQLAQAVMDSYLKLLNVTEIQREIEQTQRLLGQWRGTLPDLFDDDEREPGCP